MGGEYSSRIVDGELDELMREVSAISIEGAKGVGKTQTARQRAKTTFELDQEATRQLVAADPRRLVSGSPPVLVDEWQRWPESWDLVRRAVDRDRRAGNFLLTGSSSPERPGTHSGAGRIVSVRMHPLSLAERSLEKPSVSLAELLKGKPLQLEGKSRVGLEIYTDEICTSGFPGLRSLRGRSLRAELSGYVDRIVDNDFPDLGRPLRNPGVFRRWFQAYAAAIATTTGYETIRDAATPGEGDKPARSTTGPYREILERLWVIESIPAWLPTQNHLVRLAAKSKHSLVDPALAVSILGLGRDALLSADPVSEFTPKGGAYLGQLFESLVAQSVRVYAQASEARVSHLRTLRGDREVDLIVERADRKALAIEVKMTQKVDEQNIKHLHWLKSSLGKDCLGCVIITTGTEAYTRKDGVMVVPAALLGP
ncbi:MAG: ATP-binding protein [Polyangiaceae bacterium]|nr:ATP-binding protein [Polyangiaceae bacterium]